MHFIDLGADQASLALLSSFYTGLYEQQFPDYDERESLENMRNYLQLKAKGWYGRNSYHIVIAFDGSSMVAACVSDYFHLPNTGVIEFLLVSPDSRGRGHGKAMLDEMIRIFHADAVVGGHAQADYVMGEMNDPFLTDPAEDNLDPFERAQIWGRWGFGVLDFPYVQPPLDQDKGVVSNLLLMARPLGYDSVSCVPAQVVKQVVYDYLKWAMRFDEPAAEPNFRNMAAYLERQPNVRWTALQAYTGTSPELPLQCTEILKPEEVNLIRPVYEECFAVKPDLSVGVDEFRRLIEQPPDGVARYHLWALQTHPGATVEGMSSFFSFPWGGFGGYLAFIGSLRGTGRLRLLLAQMEQRMLRDHPGAKGWYIECDPGGVENGIFSHAGFQRLEIDYRQPDLTLRDTSTDLRPLNLFYKPFGRVYSPRRTPSGAELLVAVADIFRAVYGIRRAVEHPAYRHLEKQCS